MKALIRIALVLALLCGASSAFAAIDVVASTPELADITKQVGGNKVNVYSIAKANQIGRAHV
jgi:ABC-type Zn uptake system ZnuABC Zn-binding protein ZnuA